MSKFFKISQCTNNQITFRGRVEKIPQQTKPVLWLSTNFNNLHSKSAKSVPIDKTANNISIGLIPPNIIKKEILWKKIFVAVEKQSQESNKLII